MVFSVATIALVDRVRMPEQSPVGGLSRRTLLWQDAVVHQPHDPVVQFNLGTLLAEAGQLPEAIGHLEEAVRLHRPDPESVPSCCNIGLITTWHVHSKNPQRPQDAIEHYRAALRLRPDDRASHYNLARLLEDAGTRGKPSSTIGKRLRRSLTSPQPTRTSGSCF